MPEMVDNLTAQRSGDVEQVQAHRGTIRIAYVMGYGRSGSTLLDVMLGSHPDITSVGEVSYLSEWLNENKRCACHQPIRQCDFWCSVTRQYDRVLGARNAALKREVEVRVESRRALPRLVSGRLSKRTVAAYRKLQTALFEAVSSVADDRIIVDSSKSVQRTDGRCLALQRFTDFDVRAIYLVRDGRAVTWSALKGPGTSDVSYRELPLFLRGLWTITDWTITNLICLLMTRWLKPGSVLRVRYEDLVRDPQGELMRIGDFMWTDLRCVSDMIGSGQPIAPGHNVGGNRMRFASAIRVREDRDWRDKLPWIYKVLFWSIAWPVARGLGYRLRSG